jgi:hypothetical protein
VQNGVEFTSIFRIQTIAMLVSPNMTMRYMTLSVPVADRGRETSKVPYIVQAIGLHRAVRLSVLRAATIYPKKIPGTDFF